MQKWRRVRYLPCQPLYEGREPVTGSREHLKLARRAAAEGMVLLKNEEGVLPLPAGSTAALFGKASADYVKGGGGSGDVTVSHVKNLFDGLREKERKGRIHLVKELEDFYRKEVQMQYEQGVLPGLTKEPELPEELLKLAAASADTAVISVCRYSGEGWDRAEEDFYLTAEEQRLVDRVCAAFSKTVVVLNVGSVVDTQWIKDRKDIQGALLAWQAGMEGGAAEADILCGDANPSGKLTDTFARVPGDYPSSSGFQKSQEYVEYGEDIYVGYRWFETMKGAAERVNYPFGFGLSYTKFELEQEQILFRDNGAEIRCSVVNTGSKRGKETVQIYFSAPQGKLGKPRISLAAFQKTGMLEPGRSQQICVFLPIEALASYDDTGKVRKSAYVLEKGSYTFYIGTSSRDLKQLKEQLEVDSDRIISQKRERCAPISLEKRILADGSWEKLTVRVPEEEEGLERQDPDTLEGIMPEVRAQQRISKESLQEGVILLQDVAEGRSTMEEFLRQLDNEELASLLSGQPNTGAANTFGIGNMEKYGVPNVMTADGPAGLRIRPECGICTTAFPCATLLACTWNPELVEEVGKAAAEEVKENNIGVWLAPAMNIHRNPLCGRNFEYYSEDPLLSGKIAAAAVKGIQSVNIAATIKHFACNNKETNRKASDSRVSERALREIYLRGFEIAVREGKPWAVMSSYNKINGRYTSESRDLLTGILREEWGYDGMVMTDWWNFAEHYREIKAGNDLKMGCGYKERVLEALNQGYISREDLERSARRVLGMLLKLE